VKTTITAKISFLHHARPPISADEYANITISFPSGALPGKGDIVAIEGMRSPTGAAFVVSHRVFSLPRQGELCAVEIYLTTEDES
jgi:hypothetical protein